jgi:hypothetical protein
VYLLDSNISLYCSPDGCLSLLTLICDFFFDSSLLSSSISSIPLPQAPRQTLQHITARTNASSTKVTKFDPLLEDIRNQLGINYGLYAEGLKEVKGAIVRKEDPFAWLEQMNQLVRGADALAFTHNGVLFLLGEFVESEYELTQRPRSL